ncbi:hypothetical protein TNIN_291841 [Trichonephila inaurata madagascariensis]|uniref:Uncharacterized protein n=1 Tax=Trichonephila inaurata madagascariensis TaxID=2747483 RepID=A0A8X6WPH6_9ARAC|nr:hypothetical protein TNIN_291841 [Trichonephila inaurata madagascariensis]
MKNACFSVWGKASTYSPLIVTKQLVGGPLLVSDPYLWHDSRPSSLKANRSSSCSSHHPLAEGRSVQPHGAMTSSHMFIFGSISRTGGLYCAKMIGCTMMEEYEDERLSECVSFRTRWGNSSYLDSIPLNDTGVLQKLYTEIGLVWMYIRVDCGSMEKYYC